MTYEERNRTILQNRFSRLFLHEQLTSEQKTISCSFLKGENEHIAGTITKDGNEYQFVSRHDPVKHAEQLVDKVYNEDADGFILFGLELGYTAAALCERMSPEQMLIVIEADRVLFEAQIKAADLSALFNSINAFWHWYEIFNILNFTIFSNQLINFLFD